MLMGQVRESVMSKLLHLFPSATALIEPVWLQCVGAVRNPGWIIQITFVPMVSITSFMFRNLTALLNKGTTESTT